MFHTKRSIFRLLIVPVTLITLGGCQSVMTKIGTVAGDMMTAKTADLGNIAFRAQYGANLYPKETGLAEVAAFKDDWNNKGNVISLTLQKREGLGLYQIEGDVTYSKQGEKPQPLPYIGVGTYGVILPESDKAPREIQIATQSGQKLSFSVKPASPVKILSINGKSSSATVDLSKDLTLELDVTKPDENSMLRVSLISAPLGMKAFSAVAIAKPAKKITIPAAAFQHPEVQGSHLNVGAFSAGDNYLRVERYSISGKDSVANFNGGAFMNVAAHWDTVAVNVTGDAEVVTGVEATGEVGGIKYNFYKPSAYTGRPLVSAKRFALSSLDIEGRLFKQTKSTSEKDRGDFRVITTTTITEQFPNLPESYWNSLMERIYKDIRTTVPDNTKSSFIEFSNVLSSKTYAELPAVEEEGDYKYIRYNYKGSRTLTPRSFGDIKISSTFAMDRPNARLMKELGVDALVAANLALQVATNDDGKIILIPRMMVEIYGPPNGDIAGPVLYARGSLQGKGVPFNKEYLEKNPSDLSRIVQQKELFNAIDAGLKELEQKARKAGYHTIWALQ